MSIATTTQYWTSRMNGGIPSALTEGQDNESFTLAGSALDGAVSDKSWQITSAAGGQIEIHSCPSRYYYTTLY